MAGAFGVPLGGLEFLTEPVATSGDHHEGNEGDGSADQEKRAVYFEWWLVAIGRHVAGRGSRHVAWGRSGFAWRRVVAGWVVVAAALTVATTPPAAGNGPTLDSDAHRIVTHTLGLRRRRLEDECS